MKGAISMKILCSLALFAALLSMCVGAWAQASLESPTTPEQMLNLANHYREVDPGKALPVYRQLLDRFPKYDRRCWAEWGIAVCLHRQTDYKKSIIQCDKIAKDYPNSLVAAWATYLAGDCYQRLGDIAKATEAFGELVDNYSKLSDQGPVEGARHKLREMWSDFVFGNMDKATAKPLIARFDQDPAYRAWSRAICCSMYANMECFKLALETFDKFRAMYPDSKQEIAWAASQIGLAYASRNRELTKQEIDEMTSLLSLPQQMVPDNAELVAASQYGLADYYRKKHDDKAAIDICERTLAAYPNTRFEVKTQHMCGHALMAIGKPEEAAAHFRELAYNHKDSGYSTPALYSLGRCLLLSKKPAEARAAFTEIYEQRAEPDWKVLAEPQIAECYAQQGDYAKASEVMSQAADDAVQRSETGKVLLTEHHRVILKGQAQKMRESARHFAQLAASQKGSSK